MSWTIEQWKKFEENYNKCIADPKNIIKFNENTKYKTIYLPYNIDDDSSKINKKSKLSKNINKSKPMNKHKLTNNYKKNKQCDNKNGQLLKKWQYDYLLKIFEDNHYPSPNKITDISKHLCITYNKVKNWFQNYRAKLRKLNNLYDINY